MKKQSERDGMAMNYGSMSEHLGREHKRHSGLYRNEVEKPSVPAHGHQQAGMGCHDFKGEAQDISYGMAGMQGCRSDAKKEAAQFRNYHWDSDTGGASGY